MKTQKNINSTHKKAKPSKIQQLLRSRYFRMNAITILILAGIGFFWLYPFFWSIGAAFKSQREMFSAGARILPEVWTFDNFVRAWVKANFSGYFFNTVLYAVAVTAIVLALSSMCGYALARYKFPGRDLIYGTILATLFIPVATVIIPQFKLIMSMGLLNTRAGVILAFVGGGGALNVLLFTGFFKTIPEDLFESAKIDGANFLQTFFLVLPLAKPIIATVSIFQFMATWNEFNIPLVFTLTRPELRTLAVGMYAFQGEHTFDWAGFSAATVISFIPILVVFLLFQNYFVRGLSGAVKG